MFKKFVLIIFASFIVLPHVFADSQSIVSEKILRYKPSNVLKNFSQPLIDLQREKIEPIQNAKELKLKLERIKKITEQRRKQIEIYKKSAEEKRILKMRKQWELSNDFCINLNYYENYLFCLAQLEDQQNNCSKQETSGKQIFVDLEGQIIYGVKDCRLVVYSRLTSGKNKTPSPIGDFKIYWRRGPHWMQGEWFVNKAFYFYRGYALHDAPWREGVYWHPSKRAVYGSHGCINLPRETMETLWTEFEVGDAVHVVKKLTESVTKELSEKIGDKVLEDPSIDYQ